MGSLITETPYSEITATLEILDRFGVGRDHLRRFRAAAPEVQSHTAHVFKTADTCTAISTTNGNERPVSLVRITRPRSASFRRSKPSSACAAASGRIATATSISWLPKEQAGQPACNVTAYQLAKPMIFAEMAAAVLGVPTTTPVAELGKMLKERGLTLTLFQIDKLVEMQEGGTDVGARRTMVTRTSRSWRMRTVAFELRASAASTGGGVAAPTRCRAAIGGVLTVAFFSATRTLRLFDPWSLEFKYPVPHRNLRWGIIFYEHAGIHGCTASGGEVPSSYSLKKK